MTAARATAAAMPISRPVAHPLELNYASTGNASLAHLATELFAHSTGTALVPVGGHLPRGSD